MLSRTVEHFGIICAEDIAITPCLLLTPRGVYLLLKNAHLIHLPRSLVTEKIVMRQPEDGLRFYQYYYYLSFDDIFIQKGDLFYKKIVVSH